MYEYEGVRRVVIADRESEYCGGSFIPVCARCGRFVSADEHILFRDGTVAPVPNATCTLHGRVEMIFEGFDG